MLPLPQPHLHDHPFLLFHTPTESSLSLSMLMLMQDPQDMPPMLPRHVHPHPSLCFCTPTTYHGYVPAGPARYASEATMPCLPSPILMLPHPPLTILILPQCPQDMPPMLPPHVHPHPCSLPCLCSCRTLKIFLRHCHPISALTHAYTSAPLPYLPFCLPSLRSHIRLIGYSGLLPYNAITEVC
ncbi:hypothetical protein O181_068526 [Austropuccinia psidii MF-1]|uniref:Uncharacterized protein n=1 Tax=Austropuccinia psidii MF-1 TaxID=1389203 RepID=A0A9Q3EV05_9BASI|nr:hypothetical protein [Austropuccinia psidii MF-1]